MVQKLALPRKNSTDISVIAAACCISDPVVKMFQLNLNVAHTSRAMSWFGIKLWINDPGTSKLRSHPGLIANGHTGMACLKKCTILYKHACMLIYVYTYSSSWMCCACMYAQRVPTAKGRIHSCDLNCDQSAQFQSCSLDSFRQHRDILNFNNESSSMERWKRNQPVAE